MLCDRWEQAGRGVKCIVGWWSGDGGGGGGGGEA
jgi:hypothetical protein